MINYFHNILNFQMYFLCSFRINKKIAISSEGVKLLVYFSTSVVISKKQEANNIFNSKDILCKKLDNVKTQK